MTVFYYFLERHRLVNLLSGMLLFIGMLSLKSTNVDLIPLFSFKGIVISIDYPEATAGDMEAFVVFPIEERLTNFPGLRSLSSVSRNGGAQLNIKFPADYSEMPYAMSEIKEILEQLRPTLPRGIRNISLKERKKMKTFQNFIVVKNFDLKNRDHDNILKGFKNKVTRIRGIAEINDSRPEKSLVVDFNEKKLKEKEILISEALAKIRSYFKYVPLGSIKRGRQKAIFEFERYEEDDLLADVRRLPIKSNSLGYSTKLSEIADVDYKFDVPEGQMYHDEKLSYYLRIQKDLNSDVLVIDKKIRKLISNFNKEPHGIKLQGTVSAKGFISRQLRALKSNGFFGVTLVILLLIVFLSFRSSICTVAGLPLAYAGTFVVLNYLGMSINLLSIVGLILVAGILVDDALIVTEKYCEFLEEGFSPVDSAKKAINELLLPVLGTAMTTVVAFLPLILIPSELGVLLMSIPVVVIVALVFSILESFFVLPSHLISFNKKHETNFFEKYFIRMRSSYEDILDLFLRRRYLVNLGLIVFTVFAIYFSIGVEKNFSLNIGDEVVLIRGRLKKSGSKEETLKKIRPLQEKMKLLANSKDFVDISTSVGRLWSHGEVLVGDEYFDIRATLDEELDNPQKIKLSLEEKLKKFVKSYKKENNIFSFLSVQKKFGGDDETGKQKYLSVNFYTKSSGGDLDIEKVLGDLPSKIEGIGPLEIGGGAKKMLKWVFVPNYKVLAQFGVDKDQVKDAILGKVQDSWIGDSRLNGESLAIKSTVDGKSIQGSEFDPEKFFILTRAGTKVSLSKLGSWRKEFTSEEINHLDGFNVQEGKFPILDSKKRDLIVERAKPYIEDLRKKIPQYTIRAFGESLQESENKDWIINSLLACVVGIYFVLVLVLGSFTQPVIVSLPIVFGIIGVLLAHRVHNIPLGVLSGVGLMGAIGVSVNGSLVMADQINRRLAEGAEGGYLLAIKEGASSRFRAVFLTSMTTLGGLFPMAYGLGGDAGFTKALAFSMAWGIFLSSVLTLFFFPSVFAVLKDFAEFFSFKKNRKVKEL